MNVIEPVWFSVVVKGLMVCLFPGYCPQSDAIDPLLTVQETLQLYCRLRGIDEEDDVSYPLSHWSFRNQCELVAQEMHNIEITIFAGDRTHDRNVRPIEIYDGAQRGVERRKQTQALHRHRLHGAHAARLT